VGEAGYRTAPSAALNFAGLPVGGVSSSICAVPVMSADSGTHYRSGRGPTAGDDEAITERNAHSRCDWGAASSKRLSR
jgi:hypothetical protein